MADMNIDVNFRSGVRPGLNNTGGGGQTSQGGNQYKGLGKVITGVLKATGLLGIVMSLKTIVDLVSAVFATLNIGIMVALNALVTAIKSLLPGIFKVGMVIINGIVTAIEKLVKVFSPDTDLPKYRLDIFDEKLADGKGIMEALNDSIMNEEQYLRYKTLKNVKLSELVEGAYDEASKLHNTEIQVYGNLSTKINGVGSSANNFFGAFKSMLDKAYSKAKELSGGRSSSSFTSSPTMSTISSSVSAFPSQQGPLTARESYSASNKVSTVLSDQEVRRITGNQNLFFGGGK
jgi:hypothetical protein